MGMFFRELFLSKKYKASYEEYCICMYIHSQSRILEKILRDGIEITAG